MSVTFLNRTSFEYNDLPDQEEAHLYFCAAGFEL